MKKKVLGTVRVNSGILAVLDPAYADQLDSEYFENIRRNRKGLYPFSFGGCCAASQNKDQGGELCSPEGGSGGAVAFHSGMGDGDYEVVATYRTLKGDGERITKIEMTLICDDWK